MGQKITIEDTDVVGDVLVVDTDRSVTGQDGTGYESAEAAEADGRFPGKLASRLFADLDGVSHVFVASNTVVIQRSGGWADEAVAGACDVISNFFVFYDEAGETEPAQA